MDMSDTGSVPPITVPTQAGDAITMGLLTEAVGYLLKRAQMAVFADFNRTFADVDIRPAQFSILLVIDENPGLKQSQISSALGIKRTNIVAMLDGLEKRGLLERRQVAGDRRSYALHLTKDGAAMARLLREKWGEHEGRVLACIGPENRPQLLAWLGAIAAMAGPGLSDEGDEDSEGEVPERRRSRSSSAG